MPITIGQPYVSAKTVEIKANVHAIYVYLGLFILPAKVEYAWRDSNPQFQLQLPFHPFEAEADYRRIKVGRLHRIYRPIYL